MAITKRDLDGLAENSAVWDTGRGAVSGFGARRQRSTPVFVLKVRFERKQRWFTIGKFGAPWTVEMAREHAKILLGDLAKGIDPAHAAAEPPQPLTVSELCDRYMEAATSGRVLTRFKQPKRASTLAIDVGRIERHIEPLIGSKLAAEVTRADILTLIDDVTAGKTAIDTKTKQRGRAIVRGGAGTASRVADLLSGIFTWAIKRGLVHQNPVHGAERYKAPPKDRFLKSDELMRLGATLVPPAGAREKVHPCALAIIEMLALTGCRLNEIASLRWDEVDAANQCLRLQQTKTGRSLRPIGRAVLRRLDQLQRDQGSAFVFPSFDGKTNYQGTKREVRKVFADAQISAASCHTLRHTFATVAAELEYSDLTIAGLLGHKMRTMTSRYAHRPDASLLAAADRVSGEISTRLFKAPDGKIHQMP